MPGSSSTPAIESREHLAALIRRLPAGPQKSLAVEAFRLKYGSKPDPANLTKSTSYKSSLATFVRAAWAEVEPSTPLVWNWHLDLLCSLLESITRGSITHAIINIPPGFSKSLFVSVLWPAWEWATDPSKRYLTASYSDVNTIRDNRRLRSIITSSWYQSHFPNVTLASDQAAKVRFDTMARGWRIATSVGGMGTGEHPDRIIIDDPLKADDARYDSARAACNDWYDRTMSTRIARNPAVVIVMQRLHLDDLTGHLLAQSPDTWTHLCLPMRYVPLTYDEHGNVTWRPDPNDPRTEPGELLWPELYPEPKVRQEEISLGPFGSAGQLGQHPVPEGGGLFKREWFPIVDAPPVAARRCRGWDTADTPGGGNWTAGVRLSVTDVGIIYIEHVERTQSGPGGVAALIRETAETDGVKCLVREGSGSGKATIDARSKLLAGYDYAPMPETRATGDKVSRANPFRAQCEAGNVRMVRGPWNEAYLSVMTSFPVGKYDDDVDATSNAYNALVIAPVRKPGKMTW